MLEFTALAATSRGWRQFLVATILGYDCERHREDRGTKISVRWPAIRQGPGNGSCPVLLHAVYGLCHAIPPLLVAVQAINSNAYPPRSVIQMTQNARNHPLVWEKSRKILSNPYFTLSELCAAASLRESSFSGENMIGNEMFRR